MGFRCLGGCRGPLCGSCVPARFPRMTNYRTALIVGAGSGLSASLARLFAKNGMKVALAARSTGKLASLAEETGAQLFACDASQESDVGKLFTALDGKLGAPDVVVYNASARARG